MADYALLRKGRNALSTTIHVLFNIALAVSSTALTVISGNWVFGILLVMLSKWRVVAVRPRYWWLNIKSNLVDFIVGASLVLLVYLLGSDSLNAWHFVLTFIYIIWLVAIKPQSAPWMTQTQSIMAVIFGTYATVLLTEQTSSIVGVIICFIIGYGACRHVLVQGEDRDFTLTTFAYGMILAELYWIFYHWEIVYRIKIDGIIFPIPQLSIVAGLVFFVFMRGYMSALHHDGKIRTEDIFMPTIFSALLISAMIIFFSVASFNV